MTRLFAALLLVPLLAGCEESENGITGPCGFGNPCAVDPIASIEIAAPDRDLTPGDTMTVTAIVRDTMGAAMTAEVSFSSADTTIAIVDAQGLVRALAPGATEVLAVSGSHETTLEIEVVPLLATGIGSGEDLACLTTNVAGRAQCWGLGDAGQLGFAPDTACFADDTAIVGTRGCAISPRVIRRDLRLTSISAGDSLACGLDEDGAVWCWGDDRFGQVGVGGVISGQGPQRVLAPGAAFTTVSAGGRHACGIASGTAYCWGEDSLGQLGDARRINSTTPIPVVSTEVFTSITAGLRHTCALNAAGDAFCWGNNTSGQLGIGFIGNSFDSPAPVSGGYTYTAIAAGDSSTCGVRTDGSLACWGSNGNGQLGRGTVGGTSGIPGTVSGGGTFVDVSVGDAYACAIDAAGAAFCWGRNSYGQLGSSGGSTAIPRAVQGDLTFTSISAGARHACGVTAQGTVNCWGSNVFGALGNRLQAAARGMPVAVSLSR